MKRIYKSNCTLSEYKQYTFVTKGKQTFSIPEKTRKMQQNKCKVLAE